MADLTLKGILNLKGILTLKGDSGGKVLIGDAGLEALVEVIPPTDPAQCTSASPVIIPPPPAPPIPPDPNVWIVTSFNKTVKAGVRNLITQGMAMQAGNGVPMWPGMVMPSSGNSTVTVNNIPVNVVNDTAVIFPSGGTASFASSGQA